MDGRKRPAEVHQLGWIKPTYLGILWPEEQLLASPHEEILRDEFMQLMFCGAYGLCGINYTQTFIPDPTRAILDYRCTNPKCLLHGYRKVELPLAEVEEWLQTHQCHDTCRECKQPLSFDKQRVGREDGLWPITYYFFPHYAVAMGVRYVSTQIWDARQKTHVPRDLTNLLHCGTLLQEGKDSGHALRFWRIGCQPPGECVDRML